jgi:DNA-binding IclR family transcriptional regulator
VWLAIHWRRAADPRSAKGPQPDRNKVYRLVKSLEKQRLVHKLDDDRYTLTSAGAKRAADVEARNALATPKDTLQ